METFLDIGAGWFVFDDSENRSSVVCDALSREPTRHFGPAAWDGGIGPFSGEVILEAVAVSGGHWDQVGPSQWKWFSEDGQEYDAPPFDWPRIIVVKREECSALIASLSSRTVATPEEFVALLKAITTKLPARDLPTASAQARLQAAKFSMPHVFGELPIQDLVQ